MSQDIFELSQSTPTPSCSSSNSVSNYFENVSPSKKCKLIQTKLPFSNSITLTPASIIPQTNTSRNCLSSLSKSTLSSRGSRNNSHNRKPYTQRVKNYTNLDDYDYFGENTQDANLSIYTSTSTQDDSTVPPFTIHRIATEKLQSQKFSGTTSSSPVQMIEGIMQQINEKYDKSSKERFESFVSPITSTFGSQSAQNVTFYAVVYIQKIYDQDKFLRHLKIDEGTQRLNKIIFYHNAEADAEIFSLTFGSTWQAIQPFSCSDFSYKISSRLAAVEHEHRSRICTLTEYLNSQSKLNANALREFRHDASIFWLDEFSTFTNTLPPKVRFGQTSIRIEKSFHPENIPELLHHFSKILAGRETFTFPDGMVEREVNDRPMIRLAASNELKLASDYFYRLLQSYLRSSNESYTQAIKELNLVLRNLDNSHRATQFQLHFVHNNGNTSKCIQSFSSCPTAFQVLSALRSNCSDLKAPMDIAHFRTKLTGNVKLSLVLNGERQECKLIDILEGRVSVTKEGLGDFFRICGQWWTIMDDFFLEVHHKFLNLLRMQSFLLYPGEPGHLSAKWDPTSMHSVKDYIKESIGGNLDGNYFSYPSGFDKVKSCHFDLLHVPTNIGSSQGSDKHIYLYYIFDRFDPGIRYCSESVLKSLESLSNPASRILVEFYSLNKNVPSFQKLFPTFEQLNWNILHGSVFIVVAFVTEGVRNCNKSSKPENKQSIRNYFQASPSKDGHLGKREDRRIRSLYHEATLQTYFSKGNLKTFVWNRLSQTMKDKLCLELNVSRKQATNEDLTERILTRLLDKLMIGEYCRPNSTSGSDDECQNEVTGKLLRIRSSSEFKLFQSEELNKELINLIQPYFLSQFPGTSHKLECLHIYEIVQKKWPHLKIHFTEIETVASKRE